MPGYKRKRTSNRRNTRRTRRRIFRARRPIRSNNTHMFKRVVELEAKTQGNSSSGINQPLMWSFAAALNDLPDVSEFTNLYDQYRINKIKYTIVPNVTGFDTAGTYGNNIAFGNFVVTGQGMWNIHSVIDYDNVSMTGYNFAKMMQYSTYKRTRGHREHSRYWTPAITGQEYASLSAGGSAPAGVKWKQWLDLTYRDIPHYGLKVMTDPLPSIFAGTGDIPSPNHALRCYATFYFECKGVR